MDKDVYDSDEVAYEHAAGYLLHARLRDVARANGWNGTKDLGGRPLSEGWHVSRTVGTTWITVYIWPELDGTIECTQVVRRWALTKYDLHTASVTLPAGDEVAIRALLETPPDRLAAGEFSPPPADGEPFEGVLLTLDRLGNQARALCTAGRTLARQCPLPRPLLQGSPGPVVGSISRLWVDGELLRYAGRLLPDADGVADGIRSGELVGQIDTAHWSSSDDDSTPLIDWHVLGVTLRPAEGRIWPEISLTLLTEKEN